MHALCGEVNKIAPGKLSGAMSYSLLLDICLWNINMNIIFMTYDINPS